MLIRISISCPICPETDMRSTVVLRPLRYDEQKTMSNIDQGGTLLSDGDKILVKGISCTDIIILFLLVRPLICWSPAWSKRLCAVGKIGDI